MAKLAMVRVDYRMVHGQVAVTWVRSTNADQVIVINDDAANDKVQKSIMKVSIGAGTKLRVWGVERAVEKYKEDKFGKGIAIVIFRTVEDAYKAYKLGFDYKKLNVGQVPLEDGRRHAVATVNLSDEEMGILTELHDDGVDVYCNQTIQNPTYSYNDMLKAMRS